MLRSAVDHEVYNVVPHLPPETLRRSLRGLRVPAAPWRITSGGYTDAVRTLRRPEVLERRNRIEGAFTFDLAQAGRE